MEEFLSFKALSRMSSFPTEWDAELAAWDEAGFKALSRMSSFPTRRRRRGRAGLVLPFQSAVAHELISNIPGK